MWPGRTASLDAVVIFVANLAARSSNKLKLQKRQLAASTSPQVGFATADKWTCWSRESAFNIPVPGRPSDHKRNLAAGTEGRD
jgi:hypothetical protein